MSNNIPAEILGRVITLERAIQKRRNQKALKKSNKTKRLYQNWRKEDKSNSFYYRKVCRAIKKSNIAI